MKFRNVARIAAASLFSLACCLGFTACSRDYTVGFLYVLSSRGNGTDPNGTINEYGIDYQTGALLPLASNGQTTQGRNPVALTISANQKNVYIINRDDSNIESLQIGTDGKLYPQKVTTLDGIFPTGIALSGDNNYMYVTFTYRKTTATANSGPGGVEVYKMVPRTDGSGGIDIGAPVASGSNPYFPAGVSPVGLAVGANLPVTATGTVGSTAVNQASCVTTPSSCVSYVYVIDQDPSTFNNLLVFQRNIVTGALTPVTTGTPTVIGPTQSTGYLSGVTASSVAVAPRGVFVYVTDASSNQIVGYSLGTAGALNPMTNGPFATGLNPVQMTIDPRGSFLYVADQTESAVSAYAINQSGGSLSAVSGTAKVPTQGTGTNCVTIENALGVYLYATNFQSQNVSGFQLNSSTGVLSNIRNSPYPSSAAPTCAAAIANGTHATQLVQ